MGKGKRQASLIPQTKHSVNQMIPTTSTLLDKMVDGREFESILSYKVVGLNVAAELRKAIKEIEDIRNRPLICYFANITNPRIRVSTSIDFNDELPFSELVSTLGTSSENIDILLVTSGGSGQQVAKFVNKVRSKFKNVCFIIPSLAMSAGTIFIMSGDEIVMGPDSTFGPIDPQIPNKDGIFVPAQSILTLIETIQTRGQVEINKGQNPAWTDMQILRHIDPKDIGNAYNASNYSINLVQEYLYKYKFKNWNIHNSSGNPVTDAEKKQRAKEIAEILCNHGLWKSHNNGINRDIAESLCKLQITRTESIAGLDRAIRRFWALTYWVFENTKVAKVFLSQDYCIMRNDPSLD